MPSCRGRRISSVGLRMLSRSSSGRIVGKSEVMLGRNLLGGKVPTQRFRRGLRFCLNLRNCFHWRGVFVSARSSLWS